jgi:acyl-CoA thioesterase II
MSTTPSSGAESGEPVTDLVNLLDVEEIEVDLFRGGRTREAWDRVFGGQVIGQALIAATRTVDPARLPHSLHAYFMRPGDPAHPILYRVDRDRDGGSFSSRRVVAIQHGRPILNLACSFQTSEGGLAHHVAMPEVPPPEDLVDVPNAAWRFPSMLFRATPQTGAAWPVAAFWFRTTQPLPDDQVLHRGVLGYASDMMLLGACAKPHHITLDRSDLQVASLDHALWIHEDVKLDDWLLYALDSPWTGHARGFARGMVFDRSGRLVASVAQEGLMRVREPS